MRSFSENFGSLVFCRMNSDVSGNLTNALAERWEYNQSYRTLEAARRHIPLTAVFELTPLCNLNCAMCYVKLSKSEMKRLGRLLCTKEWIDIAHQTIELGTLDLSLTGGEILTRTDFNELYTALAHMGFLIHINTNGTLITQKIAELFEKYPPISIDVTVYGASSDTYNRVCGDASAFDQVIKGLEILSTLPIKLKVRSTFIKANKNEYEALHSISDRFTASFAMNTFVTQPVRGASRDVSSIRLSPEEIRQLDRQSTQHYQAKRDNLDTSSENAKSRMELMRRNRIAMATELREELRKIEPVILGCSAAKASYAITWDGKMIPCVNFAGPYTSPLHDGMKAAWEGLIQIYSAISPCKGCENCENEEHCDNCIGYIQSETKGFDQAAPYLCAIAEMRKQFYQYK